MNLKDWVDSTLESLIKHWLPDDVPQLESPNHITRFKTLKFIAQAYAKRPEQFMELDISV